GAGGPGLMPGYLVHASATVLCPHVGQAKPTTVNPSVKVDGQFTVTLKSPYTIANCGLSGTSSPPCVSANWLFAAQSVLSGGVPLLLQDSTSICVPTSAQLKVATTQVRVKAR